MHSLDSPLPTPHSPLAKHVIAFLMLVALSLLASSGRSRADEPDDQLSLADLVAYRAALSGKATADDARPSDAPVRAGFRDLWERPDAYRGRRVTVRGRVARTFRQGPVGSFPPLLQAWAFSTAGDPFCLVCPNPTDPAGDDPGTVKAAPSEGERGPDARRPTSAIPGPGRTVRFTGTFLKMIRYAAGDGDRLAPLIVGDRPPAPAPAEADGERRSNAGEVPRVPGTELPAGSGLDRWGWSSASWGLAMMLTLVAAGILARQHLRDAPLRGRSAMRDRLEDPDAADPPLQFIDRADDPLV